MSPRRQNRHAWAWAALLGATALLTPSLAWAHGGWTGLAMLLAALPAPLTLVILVAQLVARRSHNARARRLTGWITLVVSALIALWQGFYVFLELHGTGLRVLLDTALGITLGAFVCLGLTALSLALGFRLLRASGPGGDPVHPVR